jgi:hypothetical protein
MLSFDKHVNIEIVNYCFGIKHQHSIQKLLKVNHEH